VTSRNRQRFNRSSLAKRGNLWLPFEATLAVTAGSAAIDRTLLGRYLLEHGAEIPVGTTIGPIRGNVMIKSGTDTTLTTKAFCALFLVPEGGLTSQPALEDEQVDAMWYGDYVYWSNNTTGPFGIVAPIMTKAMRKITEIGEELQFQADEIAGTTALEVEIAGHIFMKLP